MNKRIQKHTILRIERVKNTTNPTARVYYKRNSFLFGNKERHFDVVKEGSMDIKYQNGTPYELTQCCYFGVMSFLMSKEDVVFYPTKVKNSKEILNYTIFIALAIIGLTLILHPNYELSLLEKPKHPIRSIMAFILPFLWVAILIMLDNKPNTKKA